MRKIVLMLLAVLMLGGCTQVEEDKEEKKDFDDGKTEEINATLTVINTYDDERELYIYYCKTTKDTALYISKTIAAGETIQIPIKKNKIKISYRTGVYKDFEGEHKLYWQAWGYVKGDFLLNLKNTNEKENFDIICIGTGSIEP